MQPLTQALAPWHDFYALMGGASATMVGLLFVAASVSSGAFSRSSRGAQRMFLSASVIQFASVLGGCLIILAPLQRWGELGGLILASGAFGLAYCGMAWRDAVRDGLDKRIDLEDRFWYAIAPAVGYLFMVCAGIALILRLDQGCAALALAMGALLVIAIHNAWDITIWSVMRRKE
jgi:hypothetical protein